MVVVDPASICKYMIDGVIEKENGFFIYYDSLKVLDEKILFLLKLYWPFYDM